MNNTIIITIIDKEGKIALCFSCENFVLSKEGIEGYLSDAVQYYELSPEETVFIEYPQKEMDSIEVSENGELEYI